MKPILDFEDIKKLKADEKLIECLNGEVKHYRFLCLHPRNPDYVILLNSCEEPERVHYRYFIEHFYADYTIRDILTYRKEHAQNQLNEFKRALSKLG